MTSVPLIIYGTTAIDSLITPAGSTDKTAGGSGIYAALAARLVCPRHELIGVTGDDYPRDWQEKFERCGVNFRHVVHAPGPTFAWTGRYEQDMNLRTSLRTVEGAQARWKPTLPDALRRSSGIVVAANVTPPLQVAMLRQCNPAAFKLADFMKSWIIREPAYTRELLRIVDMALMNDEEALEFARTTDLTEAGIALLQAGPTWAVVKHGSAGSTLYHRRSDGETDMFRCPALPVAHAVDPTGAGDSYLGALAGYLSCRELKGNPTWEEMQNATVCASAVAACTCEAFGTDSLTKLTREEVKQRVSELEKQAGINRRIFPN